jgi:hypothetical protein
MGRHARSAWIIRVFATVLAAASPGLAFAAATAQDVALNAAAGCGNGNLDLTLTTVNATRESWRATNLAGSTLAQGEGPAKGLSNFSGTYEGFELVFSPSQPADTVIGSYAYVGETSPNASDTAEFFVLYNCSTREIIQACFGPYGTCPQTAQEAVQAAQKPGKGTGATPIPTLGVAALALMSLLLAGLGGRARARRT